MSSAAEGAGACVDTSRLAIAIFGAIFGTLALCTAFALAIWYLVRNHQLAEKFFLERSIRRRSDEENTAGAEQSPPRSLEEVDANGTRIGEKMDLAEMSVALEMEDLPPQLPSPPQSKMKSNGKEMQKQVKGAVIIENELRKEAEIDEKCQKEMNKSEATREEEAITEEPKPNHSKLTNGNSKLAGMKLANGNGNRHRVIISQPLPIEEEEEFEVPPTPKFSKTMQNGQPMAKVHHQRMDSPHEAKEEGQESPEVAKKLREMLSAEQFGMLEANRRRLEQERRQLRELGVI